MSFMLPIAFSLLGLIPLVVLLYFLKLKRRSQVISSTYLWRKTVYDLRVNSPFQRLRKNLLLWLQLLFLGLLILALARPVFNMTEEGGKRYILLLDTSASMSARDVRPNRLEAAKREAMRLVDDMTPRDTMMLMTFDVEPQVVVPFTGIASRLREALAEIEARETATDYARAIDLVLALTRGMDSVELYLFSDGAFEKYAPGDVGNVHMNYVRAGKAAANVGITALDARRTIEAWDQPEVFARVQNFGPMDEQIRVDIFVNDLLFDARTITVPAGGSQAVVFSDPGLEEGMVKLVLNIDDDLPVDNTAWLQLVKPKPIRTLIVSNGNYFLEIAAMKDPLCAPVFMGTADYEERVAAGKLRAADYGMVIFDRYSPNTLPPGSYLFFGVVPPIEGFEDMGDVENPVVIDWDTVHPINRYVSYANLFLERTIRVKAPRDAHTLVDSTAGPLILWWSSPNYRIVLVGFDIFESRWPLRVSFPVFLANTIRRLGSGEEIAEGASVRPGKPITLSVPPGTPEATLTTPDGKTTVVAVHNNRATFTETGKCGLYRFRVDAEHSAARVVNLLDAAESNTAPGETLPWTKPVAASLAARKENREFWPWLVVVGLTIMMLEWYIYNRRVYL